MKRPPPWTTYGASRAASSLVRSVVSREFAASIYWRLD